MLFMGKSTISMAISHFSYAFNTCFIRGYCLAVEGRSQTLCLELRGKEGPKLSLRENTLAPGKRPDRHPDPRAQRAALASGSALRGDSATNGASAERNCVPPSSAGSVRAFRRDLASLDRQRASALHRQRRRRPLPKGPSWANDGCRNFARTARATTFCT